MAAVRFLKQVTLYTDGACSGNPGPGGWAYVLGYAGHEKEGSGFEPQTTNNRMELRGVIEGLRALKEPCEVDVFSDSSYICQAFNRHWVENWKAKGWKRREGQPVKNPELWQELDALCSRHKVHFHQVKGHAGNPLNERCDQLATGEISRHRHQR